MIAQVGEALSDDDATVIDADGRTLTPGMSDAHVHIMWNDTIET